MAKRMAMLVDYEFCTGCSACEAVCMNLENHGPDRSGIRVVKMGPWIGPNNRWQYDFLPFPTDWCDLCRGKLDEKMRPPCVHHCNYGALKYGPLADMNELAELKRKIVLFTL